MYSNPILKALKTRSLGPAFVPDETASISSHGSAQASLPSSLTKPGEKEIGGRSSSGKTRWWNPNEASSSSARQSGDLVNGNKKERSRKSVEEWLWDARSGEPIASSNEICSEIILNAKNKENDENDENSKPVFDLSKKDLAMAATFAGKTPVPASSASSSLWVSSEATKSMETATSSLDDKTTENFPRESTKEIPINKGLDSLGPSIEEISPAFRSFIDRFKTGTTQSMIEESELLQRDPMSSDNDQYSASCPIDALYPNLDDITCDISAQSSERFWNKTYSWYQNEDVDVRRKRELEDEGCIMHFQDSIKNYRTKDTAEIFEIPSSIFEQPPLFDEAFLASDTRDNTLSIENDEDALIINAEEETDSNDEKSSGYVGSEERSQSTSISRPSSSMKDEAEITYISTKLYRQALGRKRRYTSTPQRSPNASYESLLSTLMPPPPPPGPNISVIEEPIH